MIFPSLCGIGGKIYAQNTDSIIKSLKSIKEDTNKVNTLNKLSRQLNNTGEHEKSLKYAEEAIAISEKLSFIKGKANGYKNIGNIYINRSNYPKALEYYLQALKEFESINDKLGIGKCYGNMGNICQYQSDYTKALEYYLLSLKCFEEIGDKQLIASSYNNIGEVYRKQSLFEKALDYDARSLKLRREIGDKLGIAGCYNNIGIIYKQRRDYSNALNYYQKALLISQEIKDKQGVGSCFNNMAELYNKSLNYKLALHYGFLGLRMNKEIGNIDQERSSYENIATAFANTNQYKDAYNNYILFKQLTDSIFSSQNSKRLSDLKIHFEVEKKEAELKSKAEAREAIIIEEEKRQRFVTYAVIFLLIIVLVFAVFMFNRFKITQKQKQLIEKQKHLVEESQKEIIDSITYAQRIQQVLLTSEKYIGNYVKEFFILFKPKDIVSGDFYWAANIKGKFYLATADCTGHGVPGAFMSMLGINFLNEITIEKGITRPDEVLNALRTEIIAALNPEGSSVESKDGMDISLCCFDFSDNTLEYALANNGIYIIRQNEVIELKPEKMPVGMYVDEIKPFSFHTIQLEKEDVVYTYTDGYADQFGGTKGKKFNYKQLKKLLISISNESLQNQKEILSSTFDHWKANLDQVDDVCVIGIKV
jgi:serine phosphatase RsbU (regulator of sigma subunit)/tetratricopeptide (TPR) repeat protein